jgi:hypothetical protein
LNEHETNLSGQTATEASPANQVSAPSENVGVTPVGEQESSGADGPQTQFAPAGPAREGEEPTDQALSRARSIIELVALVVAPTTLLVALAFYFGWRLTQSRAAYFGIDYSTLGFSTEDYLLRSTDALFVPLMAILLVGLVALVANTFVKGCVESRRRLGLIRRAVLVSAIVGAVLVMVGVYRAFRSLPFEVHYLVAPVSLGLGIALLAYSAHVHDELVSSDEERSTGNASSGDVSTAAPRRRLGLGPLGIVLVCLTLVLSAFWATSEYAAALGRGRAERLAAALSGLPGVIVYSKQEIGLSGPGVVEQALDMSGSAFKYRYTGLRLLVHSGDKYFLLPAGWTRFAGTAIVLPESSELRFEFRVG